MTNNKPNDARVSRELLERALACATSTNTSNWSSRLCEDLRLALAQPADQQGEPVRLTAVAVLREDGDGGLQPEWLLEGGTAELWDGALLIVADEHPELCEEDGSAELYRHAQTATAKVVLPERLDLPHRDEFESADQHAAAVGEAKTWNACLDEVAKLNGGAQ